MRPPANLRWQEFLGILFAFSCGMSVCFTGASVLILERLRILDKPEPGKIHVKATPRMAGPALWMAMMGTFLAFNIDNREAMSILAGGMLVLLVGAWDDVVRVNAVAKLIALVLATWFMYQRGVSIRFFPASLSWITAVRLLAF